MSGGFRVRNNPASQARARRVKVRVAYQARRGNPFKKYNRFDFTLDGEPISITAVGATGRPEGNSLEITITNDEFLVEVTGFDPHRDLAIQAESEVDDAAEVQLHGAEEDQAVGSSVDLGPTGQ
jgi:hypothetical protein